MRAIPVVVGASQGIIAGGAGAAAGLCIGHPFIGLALAAFGVIVGVVGTWIVEDTRG